MSSKCMLTGARFCKKDLQFTKVLDDTFCKG